MKDKKPKKFLDSKGFYAALSVCFGLLILSAGYITMSNTRKINQQEEYARLEENQVAGDETQEAEPVIINEQKPNSQISGQENLELSTELESFEAIKEPEIIQKAENNEIASVDLAQLENPTEEVQQQANSAVSEIPVKEVFLNFTDNETMLWPIEGNILMDYSMEHTIYDPTLEQYRVNDSISIGAEQGTSVKAAAAGTVVSITNNDKNGCTVVLDHGNGWQTTYSQLQSDVAVCQNEVIEAGEVIGGIGTPSRYSVALGNHLDFTVSKDGVNIDPKTILE